MTERGTPSYRSWSRTDFETWAAGATVLESDQHGPKVYESADGKQMLKLFRVRRFWSSNLWKPYAKRFADNARELRERGIPTVDVVSWGRVVHLDRQAVLYEKLAGCTLRHTEPLPLEALGRFMATLHERGVFFRSCHLGNLVVVSDGGLGLIDIMDLRILRAPLSVARRGRNWRHLLRYDEDRRRLSAGKDDFLSAYRAGTSLSSDDFLRVKTAFEEEMV